MILGVDHIAVTCRNVAAGTRALARAGFTVGFHEQGLPNAAAKHPFLGEFHPRHDIAYLNGRRGPAIELVDHGSLRVVEDRGYDVVISLASDGVGGSNDVDDAIGRALGCHVGRAVSGSGADVLTSMGFDRSGVVALVVYGDVSEWRAVLGATEVRRFGRAALLGFHQRNPAWSMDLLVIPSERSRMPMLDDAGASCLALLSTNPTRDAARICSDPSSVSDPFELLVNGKTLEIVIGRGPGGAMVEFLRPRGQNWPNDTR